MSAGTLGGAILTAPDLMSATSLAISAFHAFRNHGPVAADHEHPGFEAEPVGPRIEFAVDDRLERFQEHVVHPDHRRRGDDIRGQIPLIRKIAHRGYLFLLRRLDHAEPRRVRHVCHDVGALGDYGTGCFLALDRVIERPGIDGDELRLGLGGQDSPAEGIDLDADGRDLPAAHRPDVVGLAELGRHLAHHVK